MTGDEQESDEENDLQEELEIAIEDPDDQLDEVSDYLCYGEATAKQDHYVEINEKRYHKSKCFE